MPCGSFACTTLRDHRGPSHACKSSLGARASPHPPTRYTSQVHGYAAEPARPNGIHITGIAICRGWWWLCGAGYTLRGHRWARLPKPPIMEEGKAFCVACWHQCTAKPRNQISRIHRRQCCYRPRAGAPASHNGSRVHSARVVSGLCMQIGQTSPPHTCSFQGGRREQEPAAYDPPTFKSHPASSPVHPPGRTRGARTCPPSHPREHSRLLEPTPARTRCSEGEHGIRGRGRRGVWRRA